MTKRLAILLLLAVSGPAGALFVWNNGPPELVDEWGLAIALYELGADPAFDSELEVFDPQGDDLTWAITAGAMPTDWTLNATTGVFGITGAGAYGSFDFTVTATNEFGATADFTSHVDIGPLVPNVIGDAEATATTTIQGTASLTVGTSLESCSVEAMGDVISTDPAIGTLVEPDTEITLTLSSGVECPYGGRDNLSIWIGVGIR